MASSSSYGHNKSYKYDVFLSFSGEDTRKTFVDHLYASLDQQGWSTFKDDEKLEKGKRINVELLQAIEDSKVYIIVFSKRYASSSWCLNELLKIMECHKMGEQTAFPVFYDVDPSEVRKQIGSVGEAFAIHVDKNESDVGEWREALIEAANLSGWDLRKTADGHEAKVIKLIIEKVSLELHPVDMNVDESLVGMEQRMQDLDSCLEFGLNDVRMIGIKGMGGAGKTTLAWSIFNKISINFDGKSFVENVREKAFRFGLNSLKKLQKQILRDVLKNKCITVSDVHEGKRLMKKMLRGKKILVVLDDVDHKDQLEMLAGDASWFEPGSRIIITTRDGQVLEAHKVKWIREVSLLSKEEAIKLFNRHAFGKDKPTKEFERHSQEVVSYAAGLPLTIKILGSDLCGKDDSEWAYALERLKTIPLKETLKVLELSYENLEDDYKEIFLDVACFLRGWMKDDAIRMLESSGFYAKRGLRVLEQKSLLTLENTYGETIINMHDHLVEMGKNIVRREHEDEPNKHSRLWVQDEIEYVLANDLGSKAARGIDLNITPGIFLEGIGKMKKLRCLIVNNREFKNNSGDCVRIDESRQYFPNSLRYLYWHEYPHWCLPRTFEANNLVTLEMSHSKIKQLWEGRKVMKKLKFLNLSYTKLRDLNLVLMPKLEKLNLEYCDDLVELHVHGECIKTLVYLNLNYCISLESISLIGQLESLEVLQIAELNLREFPDSILTGHSKNSLLQLHLWGNHIKKIPSSIGNLCRLLSLDLAKCNSLKSLPGCICSLQHLRALNLSFSGIEELPEELGLLENLENLDLTDTNINHLPGSICMLKRLKTLFLAWCSSLQKLPEDVDQLESLEILDLRSCSNLREIPSNICKLKRLKELKFEGCKRLEKFPEELGNLECLQFTDTLLKGLKIDKSELQDQILDDDSIHFCSKDDSQIQGFPHLIALDVRRCSSIEDVPETLGRFDCLEEINLSCTNVKHLPETICMLKHLKKLFLESCEYLEKLPDDVGQLESLVELDLSRCCKIREILSSFCMLKHLKMLHLGSCSGIEELPEAIGQLECLEELNLSYIDVKSLPDSICMLKHLKNLFLERCVYLEKLPDDVGQLESLVELDLSRCCKIREIPSSFCMLKHLKMLHLGSCSGIEELPEAIGQLECLEELNLSYIDVKSLPDSICMLKHLKNLFLERCVYLEKLPDDVVQLESLEVLDLSGCSSIREIPSSVCMLKHLKMLHLGSCSGIEELPEAIGQLECLEELNLSYIDVKSLPDSICMLKHLKNLFLERCVYLEKLPDDVGQLESLEVLDLSGCSSIREIPSSVCMLKHLKMLHL